MPPMFIVISLHLTKGLRLPGPIQLGCQLLLQQQAILYGRTGSRVIEDAPDGNIWSHAGKRLSQLLDVLVVSTFSALRRASANEGVNGSCPPIG